MSLGWAARARKGTPAHVVVWDPALPEAFIATILRAQLQLKTNNTEADITLRQALANIAHQPAGAGAACVAAERVRQRKLRRVLEVAKEVPTGGALVETQKLLDAAGPFVATVLASCPCWPSHARQELALLAAECGGNKWDDFVATVKAERAADSSACACRGCLGEPKVCDLR
jgi:hypothetical protein